MSSRREVTTEERAEIWEVIATKREKDGDNAGAERARWTAEQIRHPLRPRKT